MVAAMGAFRLTDAGMKFGLETLPMGEVIVLRTLPTMVLLGVAAWVFGAFQAIPRKDRLPVSGAVGAEIVGNWFMLSALAAVPFAIVIGALQVHPLMMAAFGALVLGERIGPRRWTAIVIGFLGVMLILQPWDDAVGLYGFFLVFGVVAAIMARDLSARYTSAETPSLLIALLSGAGAGVFGLVLGLFESWVWPDQLTLLVVSGTGVSVALAYVLAIAAIRTGQLGVVAPFRYSALIWGGVLGFVFFGEMPNALALIGAVIVVAAGLFVLWRGAAAKA